MIETMSESQRYHSMSDAYKAMYLSEGKPGKPEGGHPPHYYPVPPMMGRRPVVVNKTTVNVDVDTKPAMGPGEVEKAYYTYPAGFDPTNREDVAKKDYNGSETRSEEFAAEGVLDAAKKGMDKFDKMQKQTDKDSKKVAKGGKFNYKEEVVSEGDIQYPKGKKQSFTKSKDDPKVAAGRKAAKEMGLKHNEEVMIDVCDQLIEEGIANSPEGAEAMFNHMTHEWLEALLEAKKKGRCWTGYKPTPGKEPYSPGSCQKA